MTDAMLSRYDGPSPALEIARDLVVRGLYLVPVAVIVGAVVGGPSRDMGEEVAAFVSLRPGAKTDPEALRALCQARLAPYKVPKQVFVKAELPKNSAGKLVKPKLVAELPSQ